MKKIIGYLFIICGYIFATGIFWPAEWGIGLSYLFEYFQPKNSVSYLLICFVCVLIWMGLICVGDYLINKKPTKP